MSLNLDKSAWKPVHLGDVVRRSRKQVDPHEAGVERYVAGGHIDGDSVTIDRWGDPSDGQMGLTFRYVFEPGQILFVSARPYLRKSGVVDFCGVVADKTYVLDAIPENGLLQEFLPFILASDPFIEFANAEATGSMNPRLLWGPLQRYEVDLPPLDEQKRIADLLWAVGRHRNSLDVEASAVDVSLNSFLGDATAQTTGDTRPIADLCEFVVGGVWGVPQGEGEVDVLALGPRVYAGNPRELSTAGSPVRSITSKQAEGRLIKPGDIILERSGGSPTQPVGRVVMAGSGLDACIPTDFQRLLRPDRAVVVPEYLFWRLRHDWATGATADFSKKTTNISNLSVKEYLGRPIAVPPLADQEALIDRVRHFESASMRVAAEGDALATLRSSLLNDIFGDN